MNNRSDKTIPEYKIKPKLNTEKIDTTFANKKFWGKKETERKNIKSGIRDARRIWIHKAFSKSILLNNLQQIDKNTG